MEESKEEILEFIEQLERSHDNINLRKAVSDLDDDTKNILSMLVSLFRKTNKSVKDKVEILLNYKEEYSMDNLLELLDINFIEYNSIISESADEDLIEKVDKKLDKLLSELTEMKVSEVNRQEKNVTLRNSNLDNDAEEFADKLFNKLYGEK